MYTIHFNDTKPVNMGATDNDTGASTHIHSLEGPIGAVLLQVAHSRLTQSLDLIKPRFCYQNYKLLAVQLVHTKITGTPR